jgi:hypothetical protein
LVLPLLTRSKIPVILLDDLPNAKLQ